MTWYNLTYDFICSLFKVWYDIQHNEDYIHRMKCYDEAINQMKQY